MRYSWLILLLFIPVVFGQYDYNYSKGYSIISDECRLEYDRFMNQQPEELVNTYCNAVNNRAVFVLIGIFILLFFQRRFNLWADKKGDIWIFDNDHLKFIYKWLIFGLLFLSIYAIIRI